MYTRKLSSALLSLQNPHPVSRHWAVPERSLPGQRTPIASLSGAAGYAYLRSRNAFHDEITRLLIMASGAGMHRSNGEKDEPRSNENMEVNHEDSAQFKKTQLYGESRHLFDCGGLDHGGDGL